MRIAGQQIDGLRPMRPERAIPEELAALLGQIDAGHRPEGVSVLRPRRRLRPRSYIALGFALLVLAVLAWNIFVLLRGGEWGLEATIEVAAESLIVLGLVAYTIYFDVRRRDPKKIVVVTPQYLVSLGDPLGVQWFGAWEVESLSARGAGGDEAGRPAPSLEVIFKNGDVEEIFLDLALSPGEVRGWLAFITSKLEYERT
jgi:hypothetical protein